MPQASVRSAPHAPLKRRFEAPTHPLSTAAEGWAIRRPIVAGRFVEGGREINLERRK